METLIQWPETKALIRFSDCDMYGHLNNIWYLKYFLDAREEHIAANYNLTLSEFAQKGIGWAVSSNQIAYLKPARVNETVYIRSAVCDYTDSEILVEMHMQNEKRSHLKSVLWSKFVHIDLATGRRTNYASEYKALFEKLRIDSSPDDFNKRVSVLKNQEASPMTQHIQ